MRMTRRNFGIVTAGIAVAVVGPRTGAMGMSTNLERFKAIVERGFSQGDLSVADEVCAEKPIERISVKNRCSRPANTKGADRGCETQHQRTEAHDRGHRGNQRYDLGAQ
jgi:hypothetical protein